MGVEEVGMDERATAARPRPPDAEIPVLYLERDGNDAVIVARLVGRVGAI